MIIRNLIICAFMLLYTNLFAQPDTLWTKTYGGSSDDRGYSVQQTTDGGYIITGLTASYGAGYGDVWLIKTDGYGNKTWDKSFGWTETDVGYSVQQTTDGGYIITGSVFPYGVLDLDLWLIKTDAYGNKTWDKIYGGTGINDFVDEGHSVQQTTDGGYIITGLTTSYGAGYSDVWLIKTNTLGNITWHTTFGGADWDEGHSVQQTTDGGYIITGWTNSYGSGNYDVWLIKTGASGNTEWDKTYGGVGDDRGYSVQQTSDGGYIIAGLTNSYGAGYSDVYLIKTDAYGNKEWDKTFGGVNPDKGYSVQQTSDGGYIITGETYSYGAGYSDVWLIKTDTSGDTLWTKTIGGSSADIGNFVCETSDSGYIVVGSTNSYGAGSVDIYLIKIAAETEVEEENIVKRDKKDLFVSSMFKNRINLKFKKSINLPLKISLHNICGTTVFVKNYPSTPLSFTITDEKIIKLPSGVYFLSVFSGERKYAKAIKLIKFCE